MIFYETWYHYLILSYLQFCELSVDIPSLYIKKQTKTREGVCEMSLFDNKYETHDIGHIKYYY